MIHMQDPFKTYYEPLDREGRARCRAWQTAVGLQGVDGLKTSDFLNDLALRHIRGESSLDEVGQQLDTHYKAMHTSGAASLQTETADKCAEPSAESVNPSTATILPRDDGSRTEEADKVAHRIVTSLADETFSFSVNGYLVTHRHLFHGIYKHAGQMRDYDISKNEWVLDGRSVLYCSAYELRPTLEYDLGCEASFSYKKLSVDEKIRHLAFFVANLWQIHVFGEGNTRTTAVFLIKYLKTLGFSLENDTFAENAWFFRNALARANYDDVKNGVRKTSHFLEMFLRNFLLGEANVLDNEEMHV
ncbi:MAG: Fic family protein [Lachnospiraceae bacterium]|nr:Fic family protein [Lachnospiraceae bacterium]